MRYHGLAILALLVLPGCVFIDQYPSEWGVPRLTSDNTCPDISGIFRDRGERVNSKFEPSLSNQLLQPRYWNTAETVEIKFLEPTQLLIRVFAGKQLLAESLLSSSNREFECRKGYVVIKKGEFINREGVFGGEKRAFFFAPSDNALIVKEDSSALGLMLLIPVAGTSTTWSQFHRIE